MFFGHSIFRTPPFFTEIIIFSVRKHVFSDTLFFGHPYFLPKLLFLASKNMFFGHPIFRTPPFFTKIIVLASENIGQLRDTMSDNVNQIFKSAKWRSVHVHASKFPFLCMFNFRPTSQDASCFGGRWQTSVHVHGHRPLPRQGVWYRHFVYLSIKAPRAQFGQKKMENESKVSQ